MRVEIKISEDIAEPYAVLYANAMTQELRQVAASIEQRENIISVTDENERIVILRPDDIYLIRTEGAKLTIYCAYKSYTSRKRLYELAAQLGGGFMQISKSAFINLKYIDSVQSCFNSMMKLKLKNGSEEYISRTYLPAFKKYLGL